MWNIILQKLKEQKNGVLYYILGLVLYVWMVMAIYPSISENIEEIVKAYPQDLLQFFGGTEMSTIEGFLTVEFLSLFFILIVLFYISSAAGSVISERIERKTMDFFLSQPISRSKIIFSETLVVLIYSLIIVVATSFSIWGFAKIYDISISTKGLLAFSVVATFILWAIYGIAICFSSFMKSKIATVFSTFFIIFAMYIFFAMTEMVEKLKDYDKFSIFYLYKPQELLTNAELNLSHIGILLLIFVIGLGASILIFNKRDI